MKANCWGELYGPSRPRRVQGGIKSHSRRGEFTRTWWARRWLAALESFDLGDRLSRGRSYARGGQVLDIRIRRGEVAAEVQGSQARPYRVTLRISPIRQAELERLLAELAGKAMYRAKLLAGQMPEGIEEAFRQAGFPLFPQKIEDLMTSCSCPDWSNPCKHIAAVYYLLAEEFDRDPFLLLRLRGIERQDLAGPREPAAGGSAGGPGAGAAPRRAPPPAGGRSAAPEPPRPAAGPTAAPLPADPDAFWGRRPVSAGSPAAPPGKEPAEEEPPGAGPLGSPFPDAAVPAVLLHQLGSFPFWRGAEPFLPAMERIYRAAAEAGAAAFARLAADRPLPALPDKAPEDPA